MTVAVLDNGIYAEELETPVRHFSVGSAVDSGFIQTNERSHGTVCAKIIEKYSSVDEILDVTFIGKDGKADISDMSEALEFCLDKKVDAINLSCGIEDYTIDSKEYRRLSDVCKKLFDNNIKIFASQNNIGRITIPAALPYTISVEQKDSKLNKLTSVYRKSDIYINGKHLIKLGNRYGFTEACNSFACAYATAEYSNKRIDIDNRARTIDEKLVRLIEKESKHYPKADIPIVYIENNSQAAYLAGKIKNSFTAKGYNADILSSNKKGDFVGAFYVPEECINAYINLFAYFNDNDVVIVITDDIPRKCDLSEKDELLERDTLVEKNEDVVISFKDGVYIFGGADINERVDDYNVLFEKILNYYDVGE